MIYLHIYLSIYISIYHVQTVPSLASGGPSIFEDFPASGYKMFRAHFVFSPDDPEISLYSRSPSCCEWRMGFRSPCARWAGWGFAACGLSGGARRADRGTHTHLCVTATPVHPQPASQEFTPTCPIAHRRTHAHLLFLSRQLHSLTARSPLPASWTCLFTGSILIAAKPSPPPPPVLG